MWHWEKTDYCVRTFAWYLNDYKKVYKKYAATPLDDLRFNYADHRAALSTLSGFLDAVSIFDQRLSHRLHNMKERMHTILERRYK